MSNNILQQIQSGLSTAGIRTTITNIDGRDLLHLTSTVGLGQQIVCVVEKVSGVAEVIKLPRIYGGKKLNNRHFKMPVSIDKIVKILVERIKQEA